jgi:hypothetical protein
VAPYLCRRLWDEASPYAQTVHTEPFSTPQQRPLFMRDRFGQYFQNIRRHDRRAIEAIAVRRVPASCLETTAALGPMPFEVNCADASPDGRWIAVAGDSETVLLLSAALDYSCSAALELEVDLSECAPHLTQCLSLRVCVRMVVLCWQTVAILLVWLQSACHQWKHLVPSEVLRLVEILNQRKRSGCKAKRNAKIEFQWARFSIHRDSTNL